ncbi:MULTISPECIES: hypothetical protein [Sphingobacterium]|jgi:hypothetical protein|uniref:hypothetical protein n=1 Tax=Sphingobacterium TaxID=28453 RepID=UPI0008A3ECDC|nr:MULTISPECIES: hypothetical protein [Sphingobacterium]OFV10596.1 hypothetical protein HMPREF3127_21190 [Sphingobacterium sp. HMSC13C05]
MRNIEIKKLLRNMTEIDMDIYFNIHVEGYDPIQNIIAFWESYDIDSISVYIEEQVTICMGNPQNKKLLFNTNELNDFNKALVRLVMSYLVSLVRKLDFRHADLSEVVDKHERELKISKQMHDFFNRLN